MSRCRILSRGHLLPAVAGTANGILNALVLTAHRLADIAAGSTLNLAVRVVVSAFVSTAFVYFVTRYAELRGELVHAEQELNLTEHGRLATTHLGRAVRLQALRGTLRAAVPSAGGALIPVAAAAVSGGHPWIGIVTGLAALSALGLGLGELLYARQPWHWALGLGTAGACASIAGIWLQIR